LFATLALKEVSSLIPHLEKISGCNNNIHHNESHYGNLLFICKQLPNKDQQRHSFLTYML